MAKTKKSTKRTVAKKKARTELEEPVEREEEEESSDEVAEEAAVLSDAREQPLSASEAAAVARVPSTAQPTRKAPSWAGMLPGVIVVGLIALAILVQLVMN